MASTLATRSAGILKLIMLLAFGALVLGTCGDAFAGGDAISCASQPDHHGANVRVLPPTCGAVTFAVDANQARQGSLKVAISDGNVYVRTIRLGYGAARDGAPPLVAELTLHQLLGTGDSSAPFETVRNGLRLTSVTLNVNPPEFGGDPPVLALVGRDGGVGDALASASEPAAIAVSALDHSEWILVGSSFAHFDQGSDHIAIGQQKGRLDRLVISSHGNDLPVAQVHVQPANGPAFSVAIGSLISQGTINRAIAIEPPDFVREVVVIYGAAVANGRVPTVEVRGRYDEHWLGRIGENQQFSGGWVLLGTVDVIAGSHGGARPANFRIEGPENALFKRVRLVARRGPVSVAGVTIDSGAGRTETLPVDTLLMPDTENPALTFRSGPMPIASLSLSPRFGVNSHINATVEVWAQY